METSEQKKVIREQWKQNYPKSSADRLTASQKICAVISRVPFFQTAPRVGIFAPRDWEIDLTPLWDLRPKAVVFPRVDESSGKIAFYQISQLKDLTAGHIGILEPPPKEENRVKHWLEGTLILTPGLAFDVYGGRIGHGKGYYDRFLADLGQEALHWGVCFAAQLSKVELAQDKTDVRMDAVVTDQGFLQAQTK